MAVTPDFVGQIYKDTNTGNLWRANSLTPGDWTLELQNLGIKWTPRSNDLRKYIGPAMGIDTLVSSYIVEASTIDYYLVISGESALTSVSLPNCTTVLSLGINANPLLQSISAPNLTTLGDAGLQIESNDLTSISLPSLVSAGTGSACIKARNNPQLQSVSLPVLIPADGQTIDFSNCALTTAACDHILSRVVANPGYVTNGGIDLSGGTSQPPSQGAGSPHDILVLRGIIINHN